MLATRVWLLFSGAWVCRDVGLINIKILSSPTVLTVSPLSSRKGRLRGSTLPMFIAPGRASQLAQHLHRSASGQQCSSDTRVCPVHPL